jgi:hypothetical protein
MRLIRSARRDETPCSLGDKAHRVAFATKPFGMRIAIVLVLLAVTAGTVAAAAIDGRRMAAVGQRSSAEDVPGTTFTSLCQFSHRNFDDLIVSPGRPGVSHDHTYVGNTSTNAHSTLESLGAARTTCHRDADTAAYWEPTLLDPRGHAVEPVRTVIYYRRRTIQPSVAFPPGLRMVAGDHFATGPQRPGVTSWDCGFSGSYVETPHIPRCPPGRRTMLALHVRFPNCWNGRDLDSPDHKSHMTYATGGLCPASHPVEVPSISINLRYPVRGGRGYELSSGGQYTGHADFFNSWDQQEHERLVANCLNRLAHCGRGG